MYTVYGIPNCNTVKKSLDWLKEHNIPFAFHDYKKKGISADKLNHWCEQTGFEKLLNTKGTTWRGLDESEKAAAANKKGALQLMEEKNSIIKRPLIEKEGQIVALGFDANVYAATFQKA